MAQTLADPTRPPVLAAVAASAPVRTASAVPARAPRVQSVQLPREGGASALVDGRLVFVGDRLGGATVVGIDARGVALRGAQGRMEHLPLIDRAIVVQQTSAPAGASPAPLASLRPGGTQR
ncbi:MAG: hypothetical protein AB1430_03640 [Pseudomonadota bacterium]